MAELERCLRCGAELPPDAPGGHCLQCLFQLGLASKESSDSTESPEDGVSKAAEVSAQEEVEIRIGAYKLLQKIGEGGCGVVYMAEQEGPVRRRVALKVIKLGMDTKQVIARFEAERQAMAMMDHPNIAKVLDAGATESGRPYFVMELVRGVKITDYCDQKNLSTPERLELFGQVCRAIQHAHQKGIIHRDIKPSNVLVTFDEGKAMPKVIDFGIAKATQGRLTDRTLFTAFEQFIGTPAYMSPEQAGTGILDIDTRSDIYSLGVLLYELLTGRTPFDARELIKAGLDEMRRIIREKEPARPSTKLSTMLAADLADVAQHRHADAPRLINLVRGDLDWIVMKTLEKDRTRRYETANGLANDIRRFLNQEPVTAVAPSASYRLQKFIRRNQTTVMAAGTIVALLIAGLTTSTWLFFEERQARHRAVAAEQVEARLREEADAARTVEARMREKAQSERDAKDQALNRAEGLRLISQSGNALLSDPTLALLLAIEGAQRNRNSAANNALIAALDAGHEHRTLVGHNFAILAATFSPDGSKVLTAQGAHGNMPARVWDVATGKELAALLGQNAIQLAIFSPNGRRILTAEMSDTIRLWDVSTAEELISLKGQLYHGHSSTFNRDSHRIVVPDGGHSARIFDAQTGQELCVLRGHSGTVGFAGFSPDDKLIVTFSTDQTVRIWDASGGQLLHMLDWLVGKVESGVLNETGKPQLVRITSATFSPDGNTLLTTTSDYTGRIWDVETGREKVTLTFFGGQQPEFSPDGRRILTFTDGDQFPFIDIVDAATGERFLRLAGHERGITSAVFSPDGQRVVTTSYDKSVRVWDAKVGNQLALLRGHTERTLTAAFSPDGQMVVSGSQDGTARIWQIENGRERSTIPLHSNVGIQAVSISGDGLKMLAISDPALVTSIWNVDNGTGITLEGRSLAGAFSPDGRRVATTAGRIFDAETGKQVVRLTFPTSEIWSVKFSPDGLRILTASGDKVAQLWDSRTGNQYLAFTGHVDRVQSADFSPNGERIVTASADKTARVWDSKTGELIAQLTGHSDRLTSAAFNADGQLVVTTSADGTARVWDASAGKELAKLHDPIGIASAGFSSDGKRILTWQHFVNPVVRLWDLSDYQELCALEHATPITTACLSPKENRIFTAAEDQMARIWDAATGKELFSFTVPKGSVKHAAFSPDGRRVLIASDSTLRLYDAENGHELGTSFANEGAIRFLDFSPDNKHVLAGCLRFGAGLWDIRTRREAIKLQGGHSWSICSTAFSPDGARVATASLDQTARVWDVRTGQELVRLVGHEGRLCSVGFSPDGSRVITTSDDATARIWDVTLGKELVILKGHTAEVSSASFSHDGKRVLTASNDQTARIWDTQSGRELVVLNGHEGSISVAQFSPDGTWVLTGSSGGIPLYNERLGKRAVGSRPSDDFSARLWDAGSGVPILILDHRAGLWSGTFSPEGRRILTACSDGTVHVWDAHSGREILGLKEPSEAAVSASFSADGERILTVGLAARLWDARTGQETLTLTSAEGFAWGVFRPDGENIVTVSQTGSVRLWPVDPLAAALKRKARDLTTKERAYYLNEP